MRTKLVIAAVVTAGAVSAVGASAYTASITGGADHKVVGYATTSIDNAVFDSLPVFQYNNVHDAVNQITVVLQTDTTPSRVYVTRNGAGAVTCADGVVTTPVATPITTYVCAVNFPIAGMTSVEYALH